MDWVITILSAILLGALYGGISSAAMLPENKNNSKIQSRVVGYGIFILIFLSLNFMFSPWHGLVAIILGYIVNVWTGSKNLNRLNGRSDKMIKHKNNKNIVLIILGPLLFFFGIGIGKNNLVAGRILAAIGFFLTLRGFGMSWTRKEMRKSESNTKHLEVSDSKYKHKTTPHMAIIGLGGAGIATINRIASYDRLPTRRFIAIDSDSTAIDGSKATTKIMLDVKKDASDIEIMMAAFEAEDKITNAINGTNIVFLIVSPSGNVGFNTWNIVTDILKKYQVLTVIFAIKPFSFEDAPKQEKALASIATMKNGAAVLVEVSNDRMLQSIPKSVPLYESFKLMDYALVDGIERVHNFTAQNSTDDIDKIQNIMNYAVRNLVDGHE